MSGSHTGVKARSKVEAGYSLQHLFSMLKLYIKECCKSRDVVVVISYF
jgi:hypothetical protein